MPYMAVALFSEYASALSLQPIYLLSSGSFRSLCTCSACLTKTITYEAFSLIHLAVRDVCDIEPALEAHFASAEIISDFECLTCAPTKQSVSKSLQLDANYLPETLAIQLKRFEYSTTFKCKVKLSHWVAYPERLEVPSLSSTSITSIPYLLHAVLVHTGSANGGHYYVYVRQVLDEKKVSIWWKYNDDNVSSVTAKEAVSYTHLTLPTNREV